jgi:hypothetical protein
MSQPVREATKKFPDYVTSGEIVEITDIGTNVPSVILRAMTRPVCEIGRTQDCKLLKI